ncbi:hypothetical protein [Streptomyces albipurpureus]|uniref:Uncharacterized protein n=1 Tax=Streptomyces albipurpureus TaxID=2897419 RepID=A0ABT0UMI6_9ACTN|nr:hypothetical protein [Streptomyces sp. CWNU-1]MCM2389827.1 hypothetical protein [Streptomyces sp. CWNU-1]
METGGLYRMVDEGVERREGSPRATMAAGGGNDGRIWRTHGHGWLIPLAKGAMKQRLRLLSSMGVGVSTIAARPVFTGLSVIHYAIGRDFSRTPP